ncbi:MAG: long-chain fatty acid--CoA ligase, partial [Actinomycetales bacterium]
MYELLRRVEVEDPDRLAVVTHDESLTYGQLAEAARRAASRLRSEGVSRIAVADHEARVVVPLLAAASLVGVEACLYAPPAPPSSGRDETIDLLARMGHDVLVTDHAELVGLAATTWSTADALAGEAIAADRELPPSRPHLVLTTGTTGAPRGVRHDWSRLVRSTRRVKPAAGERWLLAYGLHQFAGLQVLLHVFASGATLVAPAPRRPIEGLEA